MNSEVVIEELNMHRINAKSINRTNTCFFHIANYEYTGKKMIVFYESSYRVQRLYLATQLYSHNHNVSFTGVAGVAGVAL